MINDKDLETALEVSDKEICFDASHKLFDSLLDQIGEITTFDRLEEKTILEISCMELMDTENKSMET